MTSTDRGTEFAGVFDKYLNTKGIKHVRSAGNRPQSQGLVERLNRSIKEKIHLSGGKLADWDKAALAAEVDINNHRHRITKFTPNELVRPDIIDTIDMISGDEFWLNKKKEFRDKCIDQGVQETRLKLAYQRIGAEKTERFNISRPINVKDLWETVLGQQV